MHAPTHCDIFRLLVKLHTMGMKCMNLYPKELQRTSVKMISILDNLLLEKHSLSQQDVKELGIVMVSSS